MTELNVQRVNKIATGYLTKTLEQFEDVNTSSEVFIAEVYGKLVAAHTLGWDIVAMSKEAEAAGDRLIEAIKAVSAEAEE